MATALAELLPSPTTFSFGVKISSAIGLLHIAGFLGFNGDRGQRLHPTTKIVVEYQRSPPALDGPQCAGAGARLAAVKHHGGVSALEEALARFGGPEIFNTNQGSQFTSAAFTAMLAAAGIRISMERPRPLDGQRVHRAPVALAQA